MIRSVDFVSQDETEAMSRQPSVAMITIATPGAWEPWLAECTDRLRLEFNDVDSVEKPWIHFNDSHAKAVLEFVAKLHAQHERFDIVVGCKSGKSRSPAVALYVAEATGCEMSRRQDAKEANILVLKVLSTESGLELVRP